ncbi:hypothetical protein PIIN_07160 [Serendipita indica DSM 11827]|uniref:Uncharacterized protein n=1 Tax=Serendipita indica (strain DSM 11827) TaxID=1109443 RepID=G4TPG3_SERID|nr:hypothetical protein PIIN_07160 [Serendipita indica DSM 11827]
MNEEDMENHGNKEDGNTDGKSSDSPESKSEAEDPTPPAATSKPISTPTQPRQGFSIDLHWQAWPPSTEAKCVDVAILAYAHWSTCTSGQVDQSEGGQSNVIQLATDSRCTDNKEVKVEVQEGKREGYQESEETDDSSPKTLPRDEEDIESDPTRKRAKKVAHAVHSPERVQPPHRKP